MWECAVLRRRGVCDSQQPDLAGLVQVGLAAHSAEEDILGVGNLVVHNLAADTLVASVARDLDLEADIDWEAVAVHRVHKVAVGRTADRSFCHRQLEPAQKLASERIQE